MVRMCEGIMSYLLLSFFIFASSPSRLGTLSIDATRMKGSQLYCFYVAAFAVVVIPSLFLIMCWFSQLRTSTVKGLEMKKLILFGVFVILEYDDECFAAVF